MNNIIRWKFKKSQYMNEKLRFLLFVFALFLTLFLARYLLGMAYARYEVRAKINADIDKALYIFESDQVSFNLQPLGIVPSSSVYTYSFSVSNFHGSRESDVDMSYKVKIRTTTNLPITVKLYRNELPDTPGATNILGGAVDARDEDNVWYHVYETVDSYNMAYINKVTDVYTIAISFPSSNSNNPLYADCLENIEVILESKQVI